MGGKKCFVMRNRWVRTKSCPVCSWGQGSSPDRWQDHLHDRHQNKDSTWKNVLPQGESPPQVAWWARGPEHSHTDHSHLLGSVRPLDTPFALPLPREDLRWQTNLLKRHQRVRLSWWLEKMAQSGLREETEWTQDQTNPYRGRGLQSLGTDSFVQGSVVRAVYDIGTL